MGPSSARPVLNILSPFNSRKWWDTIPEIIRSVMKNTIEFQEKINCGSQFDN